VDGHAAEWRSPTFCRGSRFLDRDGLYGNSAGGFADMPNVYSESAARRSKSRSMSGQQMLFHCHDWQTALLPLLCEPSMVDESCGKICQAYSRFTLWAITAYFAAKFFWRAWEFQNCFSIRVRWNFTADREFIEGRVGLFRLSHYRQSSLMPRKSKHPKFGYGWTE